MDDKKNGKFSQKGSPSDLWINEKTKIDDLPDVDLYDTIGYGNDLYNY